MKKTVFLAFAALVAFTGCPNTSGSVGTDPLPKVKGTAVPSDGVNHAALGRIRLGPEDKHNVDYVFICKKDWDENYANRPDTEEYLFVRTMYYPSSSVATFYVNVGSTIYQNFQPDEGIYKCEIWRVCEDKKSFNLKAVKAVYHPNGMEHYIDASLYDNKVKKFGSTTKGVTESFLGMFAN